MIFLAALIVISLVIACAIFMRQQRIEDEYWVKQSRYGVRK